MASRLLNPSKNSFYRLRHAQMPLDRAIAATRRIEREFLAADAKEERAVLEAAIDIMKQMIVEAVVVTATLNASKKLERK